MSKITEAVYQTAQDFHEAGIMPVSTMQKFKQLCLPAVDLKPEEIKKIREKEHLSQPVFAACLHASVSTLRKWEMGLKKPSGAALMLLNLIKHKGLNVLFV
jgi:putative transcriptional regulator